MKSEKEILEFIVENKKIHKDWANNPAHAHNDYIEIFHYREGMIEALEWVLAERVEVVHK